MKNRAGNKTRARRSTSTWRLLRNQIRVENRLETINRNCVRPGSHLKSKEFAFMSQDLVGTLVKLRQRLEGSVLTNKHQVCRGQSSWNLTSIWRPVMRRRQHQALKSRLNSLQESSRRNLIGIQELPGEAEMGSMGSPGRRTQNHTSETNRGQA